MNEIVQDQSEGVKRPKRMENRRKEERAKRVNIVTHKSEQRERVEKESEGTESIL